MTSRSDEISDFKRHIDLVSVAASYGFAVDKRRSCRTSVSMKHSNGDRIIVAKDMSGVFLFSSVKCDAKGSLWGPLPKPTGVSNQD